MLDTKFIRENPDKVRANSLAKHTQPDIDGFVALDEQRRHVIQQGQDLKAKRNTVSEQISHLKKAKENADPLIAEMKIVSDTIKTLDDELRAVEEKMEHIAMFIPNVVHASVPEGADASGNVEVRRVGEIGRAHV